MTHIDQKVRFTRGELTHDARRVEIFDEKKKPVVLLTNNSDFSVEDVSEIYRLCWAIESLYKQQKQNFPLHFLWRQWQCHTYTTLGGPHSQFGYNGTFSKKINVIAHSLS